MTGLHPTNVGIVTVAAFWRASQGRRSDRQPAAAERPPDAFFVARAGPGVESGGSRARSAGCAHAFTEEFLADWTRRQAEKWDGAHRPAAR